jgi:hypothetical protein
MDVDLYDPTVDFIDLIITAAFLVIATLIAVGVYKSMERPRLRLVQTDNGPRASRRDIVKYVLSVPALIVAWYVFFWALIFLAPGQPSASTLVLMPLAVVVAVRCLAHWSLSGAYHLSIVVPMVIITSILVGDGLPDEQEVERVFRELDQVELAWTAFLAAILLEYLFTTVWYLVKVGRGSESDSTTAREVPEAPEAGHHRTPLDPPNPEGAGR